MFLDIRNRKIVPDIWIKIVARHTSNPTEALKNYKSINVICKLKRK